MRGAALLSSLAPLVAGLLAGCGGPPASAPAALEVPTGTVRYIIGGDSRNDAAHVLPWAFREAKARGATAFFFLGDMEFTPGLQGHFRAELALLDPIPFYPVLGNHEIKVLGFLSMGPTAANSFKRSFLSTPRTPVRSALEGKVVYSTDLAGGLHFVALDNVTQRGFGPEQLAWLATDLARARADASVRHVVVGMHKPLAKNGFSTHGMDEDGPAGVADSDAALALFQKAKVSLIVASHVHEYVRFEQGGIPSYITGGLGAPLVNTGKEHAFHHFLVLDVTDTGLLVDVVRFDGTPSVGTDEIDD